ncbi:MAG: efflux RND transporter periplasmic adaptor subunit [Caulobacteraceae bacterium]|nr:efflux RND transporter periplasmic adaptor subunit [Caulobacteraceae bacterium]
MKAPASRPLAAFVGATLAVALAGCHQQQAVSAQQQARTVSVVRIEVRPIAGGLTATGMLAPRNEVAVSADIAGYRVTRVLAEEGDWVSAGQPLAEMDASILRAQLDQQRALAAQQKATADEREAEAARVKGLDVQGVVSVEELQTRRFSARNARAAAAAQDAAARETETRLEHLTVRAPVSGLIIERTVRPGDISGGQGVWFRMAEAGQIELYADVPEAAFALIRPGLAAKVTLSDNVVVDGTVRLVSPRVDANTRLGRVRITLPVRSDVRAGGYAKASFVDVAKPTPSLPETAIRYDANGASVMVVGANGRVTQEPVRTGQRGGGYVELLSGPPAGSAVVAKAASQLLAGDYVTAVPVTARPGT